MATPECETPTSLPGSWPAPTTPTALAPSTPMGIACPHSVILSSHSLHTRPLGQSGSEWRSLGNGTLQIPMWLADLWSWWHTDPYNGPSWAQDSQYRNLVCFVWCLSQTHAQGFDSLGGGAEITWQGCWASDSEVKLQLSPRVQKGC